MSEKIGKWPKVGQMDEVINPGMSSNGHGRAQKFAARGRARAPNPLQRALEGCPNGRFGPRVGPQADAKAMSDEAVRAATLERIRRAGRQLIDECIWPSIRKIAALARCTPNMYPGSEYRELVCSIQAEFKNRYPDFRIRDSMRLVKIDEKAAGMVTPREQPGAGKCSECGGTPSNRREIAAVRAELKKARNDLATLEMPVMRRGRRSEKGMEGGEDCARDVHAVKPPANYRNRTQADCRQARQSELPEQFMTSHCRAPSEVVGLSVVSFERAAANVH